MHLQGEFIKRTFAFNFEARTSRGPMKGRDSWIVRLHDRDRPETFGFGECAPLPGLSVDNLNGMEEALTAALGRLAGMGYVHIRQVPEVVQSCADPSFPSIVFGLETALLDLLQGGTRLIFDNGFVRGDRVPINGLIWMGDLAFMKDQVHRKIEQGFRCIKVKVGSLDFDEECRLLRFVRDHWSARSLELRLDANGAFSETEALEKLETLAEFDIDSIEQPLRAGSPALPRIIAESPIPVALDEELIGREQQKERLLDEAKPAYIILKPGLHGGLFHCIDWIRKAEERNIGWWITSALESNIGLNAVCQLTARYRLTRAQGLGTGSLYVNNFSSPLMVADGMIYYDKGKSWPDDFFA